MTISEKQLADEFEAYLRGCKYTPSKDVLAIREFEGSLGIPDFVIARGNMNSSEWKLFKNTSNLESPLAFNLIAILESRPNIDKQTLAEISGSSTCSVRKSLRDLCQIGVIEMSTQSCRLTENWHVPELEFWAFELKLHNWKRAAFQTLRYQTFATHTFVVFPIDKLQVLTKNLPCFQKLGMGVLIYDAGKNRVQCLAASVRRDPESRYYYLQALHHAHKRISQSSYQTITDNDFSDLFESPSNFIISNVAID